MSIKDQLKVLIVDDHRTSRMLIRDALEQLGIKQIVFAVDGEEALKAMMATPCHIIISDFNMPKIDGIQLLKAIRSYPATKKVPFIFTSVCSFANASNAARLFLSCVSPARTISGSSFASATSCVSTNSSDGAPRGGCCRPARQPLRRCWRPPRS